MVLLFENVIDIDLIYYNVIPKGPEYIWENADLNDEKNHSVIISMQNVVNYDQKNIPGLRAHSAGSAFSRQNYYHYPPGREKFHFDHTVGVELFNL